MIPDHHAIDVFTDPNLEPSSTKSFLDSVIQDYMLNGFVKWDSHYFVSIATSGYQKEEFLVFLPLFPMLIGSLAAALKILSFGIVNLTSCVLISSLILNTLFFVLASVILYKLTRIMFNEGDPLPSFHFALETVIWFCFNPSSIFFSAVYSESLFSLLTFSGLLLLESRSYFRSAVLFGLSGLTRSNGILSFGFIVHKLLSSVLIDRLYLKSLFILVFTSTIATGPFLLYQFWYLPWRYCGTGSKDSLRGSFCPKSGLSSNWNMPYSFLQQKYWNQGFLQYFQLKQIPNFLLATPIILIIGLGAMKYLYSNGKMLKTLGLRVIQTNAKKNDDAKTSPPSVWSNPRIFAHFAHSLSIMIFGFFCIHVQVLTRLIASSSPMLYWISASQIHNSVWEKLFKSYFILYFFLGLAMFCNFLPWT